MSFLKVIQASLLVLLFTSPSIGYSMYGTGISENKHSCLDPMCGITTENHSDATVKTGNCTIYTFQCECHSKDSSGNYTATKEDVHYQMTDCTIGSEPIGLKSVELVDEQLEYDSVKRIPTYPQTLALVEHHKGILLGLKSIAAKRLEDYKAQQTGTSKAASEALEALLNAVIEAEHDTLIGTCSFDFTAVLLNAVDLAYQDANPSDVGSHRTDILPSSELVLFHLSQALHLPTN